jgi:hypothetical protein
LKRGLLFYLLLLFCVSASGQGLTVSAILDAAAVPKKNFDGYMSKKGFAYIGASYQADTIVREYHYRGTGKKITDSITRSLSAFSTKDGFYFSYATSSADEYHDIKTRLKKEGFFCNREEDTIKAIPVLFQNKDMSVAVSSNQVELINTYTFLVHKADLPKPKEIIYAEDLTAFNSHECLRYYFGDRNVKKDIYYLSDHEIVKCTILFPNTNRQAVFLWGDEVNNCSLRYIYIGGQLMTESSLQYDKNIAENIWQLKNGIHAGMSLYSLRRLNDAAFEFYGGRSANTGLVLKDSTGKIDFKKEHVILGCMNCNDSGFLKQAVLNSDDAIRDERILFVHTIILNNSKTEQ